MKHVFRLGGSHLLEATLCSKCIMHLHLSVKYIFFCLFFKVMYDIVCQGSLDY